MEIEILLKIILAAVLGGIIGLERELSHKEAGLRTNILIAIGSTLITILSFKIAETSEMADPGRLTAQIVTGIGFLGAGAIIQARLAIHGLTTAATIWTVAAIGIAVGSGLYLTSFLITILVVIILTLFKNISEVIEKQRKLHAFVVKTEENAALIMDIKKILKDNNIHRIDCKARGLTLDLHEIQKQLKSPGKNIGLVIFTWVNNRKTAIIAQYVWDFT